MTTPTASIIIRCYNEREHIGKLLHGIFEQRMEDFEVVLVDSGSTDGTLDVATQYPLDDVVYIDPDEFSFGRALNYGCEAASGEFCVFASAHVHPRRRDWLEQLLEKFGEDIALVYGKQRGKEETEFSERQIFKRWYPDDDIERQQSPFCNNANCAIRRSVWEEFPYDETLTGLEDLDWAKRVQAAGWNISYAADAEIIHVHDETPSEVFNRYRREAIAYKRIMDDETFTLLDFVRMFVLNTASDYLAAARQEELLGNLTAIPRFRFQQFRGTYRGFLREKPVPQRLRHRFYYPDTNGHGEESDAPEEEGHDLFVQYDELGDHDSTRQPGVGEGND